MILNPSIYKVVQGESGPATIDSITLFASNWSVEEPHVQTVALRNVLDNNMVVVAPHPDTFDAWGVARVRATKQVPGYITFQCSEIPTMDLIANVALGVNAELGTLGGYTSDDFALASLEVNGIIPASGWVGAINTIAGVTGVNAETNGTIGLSPEATKEQRNAARYALLALTDVGDESLTITADGDIPSVDIPFTLIIVR